MVKGMKCTNQTCCNKLSEIDKTQTCFTKMKQFFYKSSKLLPDNKIWTNSLNECFHHNYQINGLEWIGTSI